MGTSFDHQVSAQLTRLKRFTALLEEMYQNSIAEYEFSVRLAFLFASILRVRQTARSIQLLAEEFCNEEIVTISRPLIEIVVNAAYLQYADDVEIDRYLHSDSHLVSEETARLRSQLTANPGPRSVRTFRQNAVQAVRKIIRREDDPGWSIKSLLQRAEWADFRSEAPVMALLVSNLHTRKEATSLNTFGSLAPYLSLLEPNDQERSESRQRELAEALFGVNLTMMTLSLYLDSFLRLQADRAIRTAGGTQLSLQEEHARK